MMPTNQAMASGFQSCSIGSPKTNLVRSKSLRLPTTKPKTEISNSTLSRHGSIRQPRNQPSTLSSARSQFSVFRKPAIKPKPAFCNSKSSENLENASVKPQRNTEVESKKASASSRSPVKHIDGRGVVYSDLQPSPSDSPTSLHSDKSHSQEQNSWCNLDLVSHLKRLTEEHEKLQVEYARLRMQLLENSSFHPVSQLRHDQHLSRSDSHLASIPENSPDGNSTLSETQIQIHTQENLIQNYRSEILHLQEENRKIQRKYWEQILNSELIIDEPCNGASQQVVDLIDKLDDKEKELLEATGRVQELENHLATASLELHQCQDALQDQQRRLDDAIHHRDEFTKQLRECRSTLSEAKENIDFLQIERSTLAEALQETEQSLSETKAEMIKDQAKLKELMDRARRLYAKVNDKNLQIQLLHAELDRTQGNCRDMLLSQGAELTMISMHLSQMSMSIHSLLTAAAEFSANELSLQKEMLEDVMIDFDSEGDRSETSPKPNCILSSDSQIPKSVALSNVNSLSSDKNIEAHKSLPDIFTYEPANPLSSSASSGNERPVSFVQSMVRNYEQSAKPDSKSLKMTVKTPEHSSDSVKSSIENLSSINGDFSHISSPSKDSSPCANSAFKPIGTATAFFSVRQHSIETDTPSQHLNHEEKKTSFDTQLNQMNHLIKKFGKVVELMQGKFLTKIKQLNEEKNALQEKLVSVKNKQYQLQTEFNIKSYQVENANEKVDETLEELNRAKSNHTEEKEQLLQKICSLNEKISCLEAVNAEQSQQIKNEIENMMSVVVTDHNCEFLSNAQAICDKLNYKKEIASHKATITAKEQLLQQLAQKYARTTVSLEKNVQRAEKEVSILDNVIREVLITLQSNPNLIESHDVLKKILSLVSGSSTSSEIEKIVNNSS